MASVLQYSHVVLLGNSFNVRFYGNRFASQKRLTDSVAKSVNCTRSFSSNLRHFFAPLKKETNAICEQLVNLFALCECILC